MYERNIDAQWIKWIRAVGKKLYCEEGRKKIFFVGLLIGVVDDRMHSFIIKKGCTYETLL